MSEHTDHLHYREDDPEFNALIAHIRRIREAVGLDLGDISNVSRLRQIDYPLEEFKLTITDHSHCPRTGRKFVPGGEAKATECLRTRIGSFPHIIQEVPPEKGGGTMYHVVTSNNIAIIANIHCNESGSTDTYTSQCLLLKRANRQLRTELEAKGEFPLTELRMKMRLVAAHISHADPGADPVGVGENRWWDRDLNTEMEGQRDKAQLLIPSETMGAYAKAVINNSVTYSFKIRPGVTSYSCRAHKRCQFRFVVEPESETLRTNCPTLTALSDAFWISSKYNAGDCRSALAGMAAPK
jgi:hypothetical protein